jgi:hypothetical protein
MTTVEFKSKSVWENKFRTPTIVQLRELYPKPVQQLWDESREAIMALGDVREELCWLGVPWRWSLVYRFGPDNAVLAYLVPQPIKPRLAAPMPPEAYMKMSARKLSKYIREGLLHAPAVGAIRWSSWELTAKTQLDEVMVMVRSRKDTATPVGAAS